ncbi:MAG: hypothetical protein Q8T09_11120 [Candidatus Melainabacteria bacterium]|nr:hypothetical protein [Candidatus Melainabacteria bacterium]
MTGPIRRDINTELADHAAAIETESSGLSNLQSEAYGSMSNNRASGDAKASTETVTQRESALYKNFPDLQLQEREKSEAKRRIPTEGLDPMYHNFSFNILDPRSNIEPAWFDRPLNQRILSQMSEKPPNRDLPAEAFRDGQGNLTESIDLRHGRSRLSATVSEGQRFDEAGVNLLFLKLKTSSEAKFDENVVEIANKLRVQGELFRVMELAQKVEDPQTRRGLQMAVLEESLRNNGSSYYKIALAGVTLNKPETPEESKKRVDDLLMRIREERLNPKQEQSQPKIHRPGLNEQEQEELSQLCSGLWSKDQLLWNMGRAKSDWSH